MNINKKIVAILPFFVAVLVVFEGFAVFPFSLKTARAETSEPAEADRLLNVGIEQAQVGQLSAAIESWQQALAIYQALGDRMGEGNAMGNLAIAYSNLGQYDQAIATYEQIVIIFAEVGDPVRQGRGLISLGNIYAVQGQINKAIDSLEESLKLMRSVGDRQWEASALASLGNVYYGLSDYGKVIDYSQQALDIAREIGDGKTAGNALLGLGNAYTALGKTDTANDYLNQGLAIFRETNNLLGQGVALGILSSNFFVQGNLSQTINAAQESLTVLQQIGDRSGQGRSLGILGLAYFSQGNYQQAIEAYEQSLEIATEFNDLYGQARALGRLAIAYSELEEYNRALEQGNKFLEISRQIGDSSGESYALNLLGVNHIKIGKIDEAEQLFREAIALRESIRSRLGEDESLKVAIGDTDISLAPYYNLQQLLINENRINEALEISERGRARSLIELLLSRLSPQNSQSAIARVSSAPPSIAEIKQIANEQQATLVEYSIVGNNLYIWVISPNGTVNFAETTINQPLEELVNQSRVGIGVGGRGGLTVTLAPETNQTQSLETLHQLLIEPIAEYLPQNPQEKVIFMPQGELFFVPFPALKNASGDYLIDNHTITTAPAIQVLQLTHQQRQNITGEDILIIGNPTMPTVGQPPQKLSPLPGAEKEAQDISEIFQTSALIGDRATKNQVLQQIPSSRIIHLATHGLLDDFGTDIPGAIALGPSANDNGLLTASEILSLNLNAELVVLSACDTGVGNITGDGVIGLSRSLITAGVPSVVVSLWAVPDSPTAELMTEFYQNWQQTGDKAQALRQAMLTTKTNHPNPRDWAAFTLIGEAN